MSSNAEGAVPLLGDGHSYGEESRQKWWNKIFDLEEAKDQVLFALPMILTTAFYYLITLISVMFAGHLGELQLAGSTLANSWCTVTGFALMTGLSGALETLCGQCFGARQYRMLGIYLQSSIILSTVVAIIISVIWVFTEPILVGLGQKAEIATTAALYLKYLIPGLFAYGYLQNILRFLQMQSVVNLLIPLSGIPTCIHIGITYALVHKTNLGFRGAPIAASISLWLSTFILGGYVVFASKFEETWKGLSFESFSHVFTTFKLAVPSAVMVCLEYWAFEILVLLAGMMPDAEVSTSLIAMCVNTEAIAFMIVYGLAASASTRVSNELGAGKPERAKKAMAVTLELSLILAIIMILALAFAHNAWAGLFSSSSTIIKVYAAFTPLMCTSIALDTFQSILSGVVRGCGWQNTAAFVNLGCFYLIGMTIAAVLGFKFKFYDKGLWIGLICGLACQGCTLLIVALRTKWRRSDLIEDEDKPTSDVA